MVLPSIWLSSQVSLFLPLFTSTWSPCSANCAGGIRSRQWQTLLKKCREFFHRIWWRSTHWERRAGVTRDHRLPQLFDLLLFLEFILLPKIHSIPEIMLPFCLCEIVKLEELPVSPHVLERFEKTRSWPTNAFSLSWYTPIHYSQYST